MRKKFLGGIAVLAIAAAVAFNVNISSQKNNMSTLSLANIEALAQEEGTGARSCTLSWTIGILGIGGSHSCSVTCDVGFNAKCSERKCECVKV